jgi:hypothetical protein
MGSNEDCTKLSSSFGLLRLRGESTERYCRLGFESITHIACWLIRNCFCFQPINPPSEQYFLKVWKEKVPWLKCRAYHKFMMCDECISINDRIRTSRNGAEASWFLIVAHNFIALASYVALLVDVCFQRNKLWEERRLHLYLVKEERFEYAQRILLVRFVFKIS